MKNSLPGQPNAPVIRQAMPNGAMIWKMIWITCVMLGIFLVPALSLLFGARQPGLVARDDRLEDDRSTSNGLKSLEFARELNMPESVSPQRFALEKSGFHADGEAHHPSSPKKFSKKSNKRSPKGTTIQSKKAALASQTLKDKLDPLSLYFHQDAHLLNNHPFIRVDVNARGEYGTYGCHEGLVDQCEIETLLLQHRALARESGADHLMDKLKLMRAYFNQALDKIAEDNNYVCISRDLPLRKTLIRTVSADITRQYGYEGGTSEVVSVAYMVVLDHQRNQVQRGKKMKFPYLYWVDVESESAGYDHSFLLASPVGIPDFSRIKTPQDFEALSAEIKKQFRIIDLYHGSEFVLSRYEDAPLNHHTGKYYSSMSVHPLLNYEAVAKRAQSCPPAVALVFKVLDEVTGTLPSPREAVRVEEVSPEK